MVDRRSIAMIGVALCAWTSSARAQFADRVDEAWYAPAPGQFVNTAPFNERTLALGPPIAGTSSQPDNTSAVTLGGFGGSIILGFSTPVLDDPCNPYGLDAIVYSNAFYVNGDPTRRWAEAGIIEISVDENGNGQPDDDWYVIQSPALPAAPASVLTGMTWDNDGSSPLPPTNTAWYPSTAPVPSYMTSGFLLGAPFNNFVLENGAQLLEDYRGLADLTPTAPLAGQDPTALYTTPDNPHLLGIDPDSGGGDAFDIAWAVDPLTGGAVHLDSFDFIRISTGPSAVLPLFGEVSTEVDSVADVSASVLFFDVDHDSTVDTEDLYSYAHVPVDLDGDMQTTPVDEALLRECVRAGETEVLR